MFCQFKAFASAAVGASLEEEVEDVQPSGDSSTGNQNLYEVIGTLSDELNEKPSWISEIIPVSLCSTYKCVLSVCIPSLHDIPSLRDVPFHCIEIQETRCITVLGYAHHGKKSLGENISVMMAMKLHS